MGSSLQENIINFITNQYEKDILGTLLLAEGNSTKFHYLSSRLLGHVLKCKLQANSSALPASLPLPDKPVNVFVGQDARRLPAFALLLSSLRRAAPQCVFVLYSGMRHLQRLCYGSCPPPEGASPFRGKVALSDFCNQVEIKAI